MQDQIAPERLSDLIARIYDCAISPDSWDDTLADMCGELGAANGSLCLIDVQTSRQLFDITTNIAPEYRTALTGMTDAMYDMWGGRAWFMSTPLDRPTILSRTIADSGVIDQSLYYQQWNRPQGVRDTLGLWLARDPQSFGLVGFRRYERDGPFTRRAADTARLLIPHLQRAATINRLLDLAELTRSSFAALFDTLTVPVALVTRELRVVHANANAKALLTQADALAVRNGNLTIRDTSAGRALAAAVRQATDDHRNLQREGLGIPLRRASGEINALHVLPLGPDVAKSRAGPLAAVFVAQAHAPTVAPTKLFATLFGLTHSEGRVFDHIAVGRSVTQTAHALGVGDSTVKTHLLRLYDKTGVRRQAELVHLAASLAAPAAAGRLN